MLIPDHLERIRTMRCLICDCEPVVAAHVRFGAHMGMGRKDDRYAVPLCNSHHTEQHAVGELHFWFKHKRSVDWARETALRLCTETLAEKAGV